MGVGERKQVALVQRTPGTGRRILDTGQRGERARTIAVKHPGPTSSQDSDHPVMTPLEPTLNVSYRTIDTPIGHLLLVAADSGLISIGLPNENAQSVVSSLETRLGESATEVATTSAPSHDVDSQASRTSLTNPATTHLNAAAQQLAQYFAGERTQFDVPLDLCLSTSFRASVQRYLTTIAYGHTQTYTQVAAGVGKPKAVRAVGSGCATNPIPIIIPCHRVLKSDGTLGGYSGGLDIKRTLLDLEK